MMMKTRFGVGGCGLVRAKYRFQVVSSKLQVVRAKAGVRGLRVDVGRSRSFRESNTASC